MTEQRSCYVGVTECGCWVSTIVLHPEEPEWTREVARFVSDAKRSKLKVVTAGVEEVRQRLARCEHRDAQRKAKREAKKAARIQRQGELPIERT